MQQYEIRSGSRMVVICAYVSAEGVQRFTARLYLNHGETASLQHWRGKTMKGAERWAKTMLEA